MRYLLTFLLITSAFLFSGCTKEQGCTNPEACNFSQSAEEDDGSCYLPGDECDDGNSAIINNYWSNTCVCEAPCGNDIYHEGYNYSTVQIGEQCWFAENCRYLPEVSPSSEGSETEPFYYVYAYQATDVEEAKATYNYGTYGALYNWPAVMTEGICPSGWHIPSDEEFTQLTDFLGGLNIAGDAMKSTSGWNDEGNGSNSSGFTGLPGGFRYSGGFNSSGHYGSWWSASESGSASWRRELHKYYDGVLRLIDNRSSGFSARCVRD
jgi:uncharacterized protein (TIGR02145 family)